MNGSLGNWDGVGASKAIRITQSLVSTRIVVLELPVWNIVCAAPNRSNKVSKATNFEVEWIQPLIYDLLR